MTGVAGRVVVGDIGQPHVVVSNGQDLSHTGADGRFDLPSCAHERFVSATVPAGFAPVGDFSLDTHDTTTGNAEIALQPDAARAAETFTFVQITDLHLSTTRRCLPEDLRQDMSRLLDTEPEAAFVVASGDLTAGGKAEEFAAYREIMQQIGVPVFHAAGNHDDDAEPAGRNFQDALGPLHYSVDWGALHFVVYDGEAAHRQRTVESAAAAFPYQSSTQDDWLRADLAAHAGRPIVVVNHFPWGDEFYGGLRGCGVIATISGHWHSSRRYEADGITHYNTPTLCFGGIDQSARGYRVFRWDGERLSASLRALTPQPLWPGVDVGPGADVSTVMNEAASSATANGPGPGVAKAARGAWLQFHGGPQRRGCQDDGPAPPLRRVWSQPSGAGIHTASCIVADGLVLQSTRDEEDGTGAGITALDEAGGQLRWRYRAEASIRHSVAVTDGHVYAVTMTGQVLCLQLESGDLQWTSQLGDASQRWVYSTPLLAHGRLYAGVSSHLVALDPTTGHVLWHRDDIGVDDWISSYPSPAADENHLVVPFYTQPQTLLSLDPESGETRWALHGEKANYIYSTPVLADERVFAVSGSAVRAYDLTDGTVLWEQPVSQGRVQTTPALAGDRLLVATGTGQVLCLDTAADGTMLWSWDVPTQQPLFTPYARQGPTTLASPLVVGKTVFVPAADGVLYALSLATGQLVWAGDMGAPLAAPVAVSGACLYVGDTCGTVHCLTEGPP